MKRSFVATLKVWYPISELALWSGIPTLTLRTQFKKEGVAYRRYGLKHGRYQVYLRDLQRRMPKFWQSLLEIEALRFRIGNWVPDDEP